MASFERGQSVETPLGCGKVAYQRMASPTYTDAEAVSVILDSRKDDPNYRGTMFPAEQVKSVS